jgi:TP901 family phage tail tape measure protein
MANSDIIKIGFDYRASLAQFEKETNGVFDGISNKAGKQKITIQLDAKGDKVIDKIKELQKLKLDKFTFEFGNSGLKEQLQTFDKLENKINEIISLSKGIDLSFNTKNKADAYNQLKKYADAFKDYYGNEEAMATNAGAKAGYAYYKAYEEALRKGVAQSKLEKVTIDFDVNDSFFSKERIVGNRIKEFENFQKYGNADESNLIAEITSLENRLLKFNSAYSQVKANLGDAPITSEITKNIEEYVRLLEVAESRAKDAELFGYSSEDINSDKDLANMYLDFAKEDATAENKKYIESLKQEETQAIATAEAEQKLAVAQKETVSNTSNSNNSQIEELKSDIQEVKTELGDVKDRISSIESNGFENVRDDVEKTKESVKELNSEFAEMKSNLSSTSQESNISLTSDSTVEQQIKSESELNAEIEKRENIIRELQQLLEKLTVHEDFHGNDRYFADQLPTEEEIREADKRIKQLTGTNNIFNVDKLIQDRNKWLSEVKYSLEEYDDLIKANDQKALDEYTTRGLSRIGGAESFFGYEDNNFSIASKFDEEKEKIQNEINDLYTDLDKLDEKMNLDSNNSSVDNTVQSQEKLQSELKETQKQAEKTAQAVKESTTTASTGQKKDAFHSDIDTSSSVKSLENLEEEIKKIFTDANELQNILDSLHNGKYFHLSWTTDGIDETGADERVRQLSKLLKEYGYTINNFKSDSDAFDTSGVINAIKEENNILEQNTQKVKENTQAKEQNANVNLNKYDKRLDSYNGKIDKYKTTIDRFNDGGWTSSTYLENVQAVKNAVHEYETLLNELKGKDASLVTSDDISKLDKYEKKIKDTIATVTNMSASEKGYNFVSGQKELDKIHKLLNENSKMSSEAKAKIKAYYAEIESGNPSMSLDKIHGEILKIYNAEVEAGRAGRTLWDTLKNSGFHQLAAQMAGMFGFYDVINLGKEGLSVVRELNTALTEMRKVSDESLQSLKNYQNTTFDTADAVGTTAKQIQTSTADYMRLGESLDKAAESAKTANVLLNVSEFDNIEDATKSLVAMGQAYKDLDKMTIVDKLNEVGNNYAISTDELATALQKSAATLSLMGNTIDEAASLVTTANATIQDADSVSAGLRTISLRLVGTEEAEEELSAMNEEVDAFVKATNSKKQQIIKDYTAVASNNYQGFDILDSNGNYKNTYEILLGIAKVYKEIQEQDKKLGTNHATALIEELAGKNRSNIASAILQDPTQLEAVKKSSEEALGSAEKELNSYLDSIDGKMAQLENRAQEFWFKVIDSETIKNGIGLLSTLLKGATDFVDTVGLLPTILAPIAAILGKGKSIQRFCPVW